MAIHPTAIIDPKAELHEDIQIGPYCVIDANVRVSAGCRLYQNVFVTGHTEIGEGCVLHPGVVVGHEPQDTKYGGERSFCRIGRNTVLREHVTVHRGTAPDSSTTIGAECFLLAGSHVGHNCTVGDHVTLINNALLSGHVTLEDDVTVGGGGAFHQFVRIGRLSMIAGHASVGMDVMPFSLTDRDGRIVGLNKVGLKRAETPPEQIDELSEVFRTLLQVGKPFADRVEEVASLVQFPPSEHVVEFLRQPSERGFGGRTRKRYS